jgi:hypothetical protein
VRERKELVREVRAAFAGADRPEPLFVQPDRLDEPWFREIEAKFAEREDLDAAFLIEHVHAAHYLQDGAFRWFVRSLLFETLSVAWDSENDLVHRSLSWLRPNPIAVLQTRTDYSDGLAARLRLSDAQRVVVARVLGAMMRSPAFTGRYMPYRAAQAIAWCWRDDPSTLAAAEAMRAQARSYARPPARDAETEQLVRHIEDAFRGTPMPAGRLMWFTDEEAASREVELAGTAWQTMEPWLLSLNATGFFWMTPEAFRYFIPAALRAQLLGVAGDADPDYHLAAALQHDPKRKRPRERVAAFNATERAAIAAYLRFRLGVGDELDEALAIWA